MLIATALLATGCAAETHEELTTEAARLAPIGAPVQQARSALESAGFTCVKSYIVGKGDVMCDRSQTLLSAGCVQHVLLTFDASIATVAHIDVTGPYCAGL
jgi:hypothetical protein